MEGNARTGLMEGNARTGLMEGNRRQKQRNYDEVKEERGRGECNCFQLKKDI